MSKIYPFRWYEKVCVGCLMGLTLGGIIPIAKKLSPVTPIENSRFCIVVGFILNVEYCWDKHRPKKEIVSIPPSDSPDNCGAPGICKPECPCN